MCDTGIIAANKFRTAATDIDYQQFLPDQWKSSLRCQKRIGRFIIAGDDTNLESQLQPPALPHFETVAGVAKSAGSDRYHFAQPPMFGTRPSNRATLPSFSALLRG